MGARGRIVGDVISVIAETRLSTAVAIVDEEEVVVVDAGQGAST